MTSGYTPCACRDCPDVTVSHDVTDPELCNECIDANCTAHQASLEFATGYACQREDAYEL